MSNCHAKDSEKCGVKGGPSSTPSSLCLCSRMTLWTRISMAFICSRTPSSLVRVVRNRIEDRNFGNENMQSSHPHAGQCTARGWIWSRSHRRSRATAWGGSSLKDNERILSNNLSVFFYLEYADRDFISPFRRVDYFLAHLGTGFCCAHRPTLYDAGTSPGALREVRRWLHS